jgi:hypothetical protein
MSARGTLLLPGLLFIGLLTVGEARAGAIQCGATLGPGGTFMLDADLTCPRDLSPASQPALRVVDAVLDLNGHILSCADGGDGITLEGAAVVNGTMKGCARGVFIDSSHNVVSRVTIVGFGRFDVDAGLGDAGVFVKSGSGNLIIDSSASRNGGAGFASYAGATFIDNTAEVNRAGFWLTGRSAAIGNTATGNDEGFFVAGSLVDHVRLLDNRALRNRSSGFFLNSLIGGQTDLAGNVAKFNSSIGFHILGTVGLIAEHNVSNRNDFGGFVIIYLDPAVNFVDPAGLSGGVIRNNRALHNVDGCGICVEKGNAAAPGLPRLKIKHNTVHGHQVDLVDQYRDCATTLWKNNTFDTRSRACID